MDTFPEHVSESHRNRLEDPQRLGALADADVMDTFPEEVFDRAVRLATRVIGVPVGLLSFVDAGRQFFKAQVGLTGAAAADRQTPLSHSFCQYVVSSDAPLAVRDARDHPLLKDNLAIRDLDVIAYLGVPIHGPGGEALGSFCAIDSAPRDWTVSDSQALDDISTMIEQELALWRLSVERKLLIEEMQHRTRNLFTLVSGIVGMAAREAETVDELKDEVQGRLRSMSRAQDLIVPVVVSAGAEAEGPVDLDELLGALIRPLTGENGVEMSGPTVHVGPRAATSLALAFHELTTNAVKYGALSEPDGTLAIEWRCGGEALEIDWTERGIDHVDPAPERQGFGSRLLRVSLEGNLRGRFETDWHPHGVQHRISVPRETLTA